MLEELFASKTTARLIEFLITHDTVEFNQKDVCEAWGLNSRSLKKPLKTIRGFGLIRESRRIAHSVLYKTDKEHPLYPILKKMVMELSLHNYINGD